MRVCDYLYIEGGERRFTPSLLFGVKTEKIFAFSSTAERDFGFSRLILRQTPFRVLLGFNTVIAGENLSFKIILLTDDINARKNPK